MRQILSALVLSTGLTASSCLLASPIASADTETCVTHAEFDRTSAGETPNEVAARFDVFGYFLRDDAQTFTRGYRTCWAPGERRAVVVYSYDSGTSVDWYTHDT